MDKELEQFQADLLQSVKEMKVGTTTQPSYFLAMAKTALFQLNQTKIQ